MEIKIKYNLGDKVIINGQRYTVERITSDTQKDPITGKAKVTIIVYGAKKIAVNDTRVITLGDAAIERDVEADPIKD